MSDDFQQQDASMEEILGSIRKILSSDDDVKKTYPKQSNNPNEPIELSEVADLDEDFSDENTYEDTDKKIESHNLVDFKISEETPKQPWEKDVPQTSSAHHESITPNTRLVSQATLAASNAALSELTKHVKEGPSNKEAPINTSVEDLLKSMLTPLLKDWLDKNLPTVIEKVVREEVRAIVNNVSK